MKNWLDRLEDPGVFAVGKLPPHGCGWPAKRRILNPDGFLYDIDDWRLCLNDCWRILWKPSPADLPADAVSPACNDCGWDAIDLPANFEMLGYGTPLYINSGYAFPPDPPYISKAAPASYTVCREPNPSAVLRRKFRVPADWHSRQLILYVGAAQTALGVYCNGRFVGYSEDSMGAAEFDLTPFLVPDGENLLALAVAKYSSASYLEDQDCWRLSGVFRDIFLYSRDARHFADVRLLPDAATGTVHAEVEPSSAASSAGCVWHLETGGQGEGQVLQIPDFQLWSAETPVLYHVAAVLTAPDGEICDIRHFQTGFHTEEIRDGIFYFNGKPIKFHGVNRHEFDPGRGRAVTRAGMMHDIELIKAAHFDAVRTSHYMNHPLWYELCDRFGFYVCNEANIESHGLSYHRCVLPGDDPMWLPAVLDRVRRLVLTGRNHVSVTLWSLGNEAGYGTAFEHAAKLVRELDPRPIQYADMNKVAEFDSQTYPTPVWLDEYIRGIAVRKGEHGQISHERQHGPQPTNKPFIMNEYAHAMGNSTGNLREYWEMIEKHPRLTGGFVWEWCEHGLLKDGVPAYGGDFGDIPNANNFCLDGLMKGDRTPNPGYFECRQIQQPFAAALDAKSGTITLRNKAFFRAWQDLPVVWQWLCNGFSVASGSWSVSAGPGEAVTLSAPPCPDEPGERILRVHSPVGDAELPLVPTVFSVEPPLNPCWTLPDVGETVSPMWYAVPWFDRALTDNDRGCRFPPFAEASGSIKWFASGGDRQLAQLRYDLRSEPARVGILLQIPEVMIAQVRWYGRGPHEAYCDRKCSALVGRYTASPDELDAPYTRPQENGQRCDVRELELVSADGSVVRITSSVLFGFTLRHYSPEMLASARHECDLLCGGDWFLHLDVMQRGVGGDDSWSSNVHPEYRIKFPASGKAEFLFERV